MNETCSEVSTKNLIIDSHVHSGHWVDKHDVSKLVSFNIEDLSLIFQSLLRISDCGQFTEKEVDKILLSNLDCFVNGGITDEFKANNELLLEAERNSKFYVFLGCEPTITKGNSSIIKNFLLKSSKKIVGLKFHPRCVNLSPCAVEYRNYFELANLYQKPCLIHSDVQIDENGAVLNKVSSPETIYEVAKRYPNLPIIMAHCGAGDFNSHKNAIDVLLKSIDNKDANLYVDISWIDWNENSTGLGGKEKPALVLLIQELIKRDATHKILFGSDAPLGCYGEIKHKGYSSKQAYEKTISDLIFVIRRNFPEQADFLINRIFYKNAEDLFFINIG